MLWPNLIVQFRRYGERLAWLAANEGAPDWQARDERTQASGTRFGRLRDELIEWSDAPPAEFLDLLGEVLGADDA